MKTREDYLFLLGGHDLEMLEIRNLLINNGLHKNKDFFDKNLSWGAFLSAYQEVLETSRPIVGIELKEDIPLPKNYIRIDHHNKDSYKPSSIEQVATLLGIQLSRFQQLVAANDKGYIPALKDLGASPDEIKEIRRLDRAAQGATEADEELAEQSIKQAVKQGGILIIPALTKKFSTITDRLYGQAERLLISHEEEFTYYGTEQDKTLLIKLFEKEIDAGNMYSGGQNGGFISTDSGKYSPKELTLLKNKLLKSLQNR